ACPLLPAISIPLLPPSEAPKVSITLPSVGQRQVEIGVLVDVLLTVGSVVLAVGTVTGAVTVVADGRVVYAGNALRGYGNLIIIKHNDDYLSAYAHNDTMLVREQQEVKAGQKIATMGSTGTSSTRLHFEIRYKGKSVNPLRYLPQR
ncbi:peptidoglycan DD-metalloendopeptidase family protein, partial [Escherichia coli]|uniref:peptidoglycan DD-metalloendopeptidase family protein n=1 Tax=Escherichia coli TaxID=562 RepID=UPI00201A4AF5